MTDEINVLALHCVGGRLNPEPSREKEARYYGDPAKWVNFGKRKEAQVDRQTDKEKADTLLMEWYRWTKLYRPNLGAPKIAPYCKQSQSSKQYEDASDLTHDRVYQNEMKTIDYCVDAIAVPMQQAIGTEMRNREVRAKVWRDSGNKSYADALSAVMSVMRKRGLFD